MAENTSKRGSSGPTSSLGTKVYAAYGAPSVALAALTVPVYIYVPVYYADEVGLALGTIGFLLFIARIIDAISDPVIGYLSDEIDTRWGRRKPWLAIGTPFALLTAIMLCLPAEGVGNVYLFFWSAALYIAWTAITLPYNAWGAEMSGDYAERSRITGWREALTVGGTLIATGLPWIVGAMGFEGNRPPLVAIVLFASIVLPVTVYFALRLVPEPRSLSIGHVPWREGLAMMARNIPFVRLIAAYLINGIANSLPATLFLLFVTHNLQIPDLQGPLLFAYFASGVAAVPLWVKISDRFGKHRTWVGSMAWACLIFVWVPLLGPGDFWPFLIISILSGASLGADLVLPASMQADVVDIDTLESGEQRTGLYFAAWGVATKLALAGAVGVAYPILELIGFNAQANENSDTALFGLAFLYGFAPVCFKVAAALLVWRFPIDEERQHRTRTQIETRSSGQATI